MLLCKLVLCDIIDLKIEILYVLLIISYIFPFFPPPPELLRYTEDRKTVE